MLPCMHRAGLLILLAMTLPLAGCVEGGVDRIWNDLEAQPDYVEKSLYHDQHAFAPTGILDPQDPPEDPDDLSDREQVPVTVPEGTRSMTVIFDVNFSMPDTDEVPIGNPLSQEGQITIYVQGPSEEENQTITYEQSARGGFDFNGPTPGEWTLAYEALGEGTVEWRVFATVPTDDA